MKYALIFVLLLTGCVSVPVERKFPSAPDTLLQSCIDLKMLNDGVKLSEVAKTITENYTIYHECSLKTQSWIEWYTSQKKIFENAK
jgi:hypothetical protein